jgi:hypothetical protein
MGWRARATYEFLMEGSGFLAWKVSTMKLRLGGTFMLCGPKGTSVETVAAQCSTCGRHAELFELPGRKEKYCWECSADVATSLLLATEIDAAAAAGEDTGRLQTEFVELGRRLLWRAQLG